VIRSIRDRFFQNTMRIFILTEEEPFYLPTFMDTVLTARGKDVLGVSITPHLASLEKKKLKGTVGRYWDLFGPRLFLLYGIEFAWVKLLDRIHPLLSGGRFHSVAKAVASHKVPTHRPKSVNGKAFLAMLADEIKPDVIVSVACPQILKEKILSLPPLGCINVHGALLPRYRGMMPSFWALYHGETKGGVSVHYMTPELDAGGILVQKEIDIAPDETLRGLMAKSKQLGAQALLEALDMLESGAVTAIPNPAEEATSFSFPTKAEAREFRRRGRRFR
jgi:methionyl-tRNA formyltransferase